MPTPGVAVDIGGTKILSAASRDPRSTRRVKTRTGAGAEGVLHQVAESVLHWGAGLGGRVVVASAGHLDLELGRIREAANLPFRDYAIVRELSRATSREVELIGDATAATVAELTYGDRPRHANGIYVTISTGIGMGVVRAGRLDWENGFGDRELGHVQVESGAGAEDCLCGRRGCVEAYASGASIIRRYAERSSGDSALHADHDLTVSEIVARAGRGDVCAGDVVDEALTYLARPLCGVVRRLRASILVLGGGVMVHSGLLSPLAERIRALMGSATLIIEPAAYAGLSAIYGAAAVCERRPEVINVLGGPWAQRA